MRKPKIKDLKTTYSFKLKVSALKRLRENNYNYSKTARELSLVYKTIQRWEASIGKAVFDLLDNNGGDVSRVSEEEVRRLVDSVDASEAGEDYSDQTFYNLVRESKIIAAKRLRQLLHRERDFRRIAETLKLLIQISRNDQSGKIIKKTEFDNHVDSFLQKYRTKASNTN